jgi:hypothetical protein
LPYNHAGNSIGERKNIQEIVDEVVNNALNQVVPSLREQIVKQVVEAIAEHKELHASPQAVGRSANEETFQLDSSLAAIQTGTSQVEILDALIEGASKFAARTALFVVRGTNAVGWRARGFNEDDAIRSTPLELNDGLAGKALQIRSMVVGPSSELMAEFNDKFGAPQHDSLMLPLAVRDKVVALLYADGGVNETHLDPAALQSLIRVSGLWLEVFATRKATGATASAPAPPPPPQAMAAAAAASVAVPVAPAPVVQPEPVAAPSPSAEPEPQPQPVPEVASPSAPPVAVPAGPEVDVHKKARRFAKLLVDEIKLYNQAKVTEGRQRRDLYDRLREDIEKSRASYEKRYGSTVAKDGDYFNQELIRILADNNAELLGNNFRR